MESKIEKILPILQCPRTKTALRAFDQELVSEAGERYPFVNGKPILVRNIEPLHTTPPARNIISKNTVDFTLNGAFRPDVLVLHLGCGDVPAPDPRVISLDVIPTASADIVAEAEALPFAENSVDFIYSGAVFEHLHAPLDAIAEVRRVLKEGGELYIDTAFMQTYHGFPSHYFNMTPQAIETFLVDDFHLLGSVLPRNGSVVSSLPNLLGRLLSALPAARAERIRDMKVGEFITALTAQRNMPNELIDGLSHYSQRAMAACYVVKGRKPLNYREGVARAEAAIGKDGWKSLKRRYYAARNAVMRAHHEVDYFRRLASEAGARSEKIKSAHKLEDYLHAGAVADPMAVDSWSLAIARLERFVSQMTEIRNQWIRRYLAAKARAPTDSAPAESSSPPEKARHAEP